MPHLPCKRCWSHICASCAGEPCTTETSGPMVVNSSVCCRCGRKWDCYIIYSNDACNGTCCIGDEICDDEFKCSMLKDNSFERLACDLTSVSDDLLNRLFQKRKENLDQLKKQKCTERFEMQNSKDDNFNYSWIFEFQPRPLQITLTVYPFTLNDYANDIVQHNREPRELMKYEWSRYLSFNNFPSESNATPLRLAQAGFFSTNQGEEVECFCCGVRNAHWPEGESVWNVHRRLSPVCRFVRGESTDNVAIHGPEYYSSMDHSQ